MNEQVIDLIKNRNAKKLYGITMKNPSETTLRATDEIAIHRFAITSENLFRPFEGEIVFMDLNILERPFNSYALRDLEVGALTYAAGQMALNQHYSMKEKIMLFNYNMFDSEPETKWKPGNLRFNNNESNIFDREMLVMPAVIRRESFLTVVVCPRGALVSKDKGTGSGTCQMYHFGTSRTDHSEISRTEIYRQEVEPKIMRFLENSAKIFEKTMKFVKEDVLEQNIHVHDIKNIERYSKSLYILTLIEKIMSSAYTLPDMDEIVAEVESPELRPKKRKITALRLDLGDEIQQLVRSQSSPVIKYLMTQRDQIIRNHRVALAANVKVLGDVIEIPE